MKRHIIFLFVITIMSLKGKAQTIESIVHELPPCFSVLTTWGLRPEWDEKSENIYFLNKMVGDVFKINIKTQEVTAITSNFYHGGIFRVQCLSNGDLLLGIGGKIFDSENPEKNRHKLEMFILRKENLNEPISLGEYFDEGPAVSKNSLRIAWTLPGQREICAGDIEYTNGVPEIVNKKIIISYKDSSAYVRLETQNFRPPFDKELIYTHYWGDERDAFKNSQTFGFNPETGITTDYTHLAHSYNEAEGIFPDGKYMMIESDRHQTLEERNKYKLDVYRLKLDGSGEAERFAFFSTKYPNLLRSDNPVVDRSGRYIALQFGFLKGSGDGKGIFIFDIDKFEKSKEK